MRLPKSLKKLVRTKNVLAIILTVFQLNACSTNVTVETQKCSAINRPQWEETVTVGDLVEYIGILEPSYEKCGSTKINK